jgi:hypothetical protein
MRIEDESQLNANRLPLGLGAVYGYFAFLMLLPVVEFEVLMASPSTL